MKFDDLDAKLRVYETASDRCVPPGVHMVARVDGRGFTKLTKDRRPDWERPFDPRFRDMMLATCEHLMTCGFTVIYGYTQSDEISLLFHPDEKSFGRKLRKYNSVLAGEASAKFTSLLGEVACFDCRVSELPSVELVVEYFRWRNEDAARNSLSAHCYWGLRKAGRSEGQATSALNGLGPDGKHELLFSLGTNFNDLAAWQRRGIGLSWETYVKEAKNPKTGETVQATRRRIAVDLELPMKDAYEAYVRARLEGALGEAEAGKQAAAEGAAR